MNRKNVKLDDYFDEYGVYDLFDVCNSLDKYIGFSFSDLLSKFCSEGDIISSDDVTLYCINNFNCLLESKFFDRVNDEIINDRISDYDFLVTSYNIYKDKGLDLLMLMQYIISCGKGIDEEKELLLLNLNISHKNGIICGRDVIRLLICLTNIVLKLEQVILEINDFSTYNRKKFDWFALNAKDNILPSRSLIYDENKRDNTSVRIITRRWN